MVIVSLTVIFIFASLICVVSDNSARLALLLRFNSFKTRSVFIGSACPVLFYSSDISLVNVLSGSPFGIKSLTDTAFDSE